MQLPHQLDAVLHAAEGGSKLADGLVRHQAVYGTDGRFVIFDVVNARQQNIRYR